MKVHFEKKYDKFSFEFIEDSNFPEKKLVTCVFALVKFEWKIYLTKNHRWWELPWWHIEWNETFDEALDREMWEEIWTKIENKKLWGYKKILNFKKTENRNGWFYPYPYSYILFYITEWTGDNYKIPCPDTIDYWLFTVEEALEKVNLGSNKNIINILI